MTKLQRQVLEFHRVFDHPVADSPTIPRDDRVRFRLNFVVEELFELLATALVRDTTFPFEEPDGLTTIVSVRDMLQRAEKAMHDIIDSTPVEVDLPPFVDALADIDYVVEGCRLEFGVNGEPIADEVHRANMTKAHPCPDCNGTGMHKEIGGACARCGCKGRIIVKREDGKTLKPEGWTPPDIAGELEEQHRRRDVSLRGVMELEVYWRDK